MRSSSTQTNDAPGGSAPHLTLPQVSQLSRPLHNLGFVRGVFNLTEPTPSLRPSHASKGLPSGADQGAATVLHPKALEQMLSLGVGQGLAAKNVSQHSSEATCTSTCPPLKLPLGGSAAELVVEGSHAKLGPAAAQADFGVQTRTVAPPSALDSGLVLSACGRFKYRPPENRRGATFEDLKTATLSQAPALTEHVPTLYSMGKGQGGGGSAADVPVDDIWGFSSDFPESKGVTLDLAAGHVLSHAMPPPATTISESAAQAPPRQGQVRAAFCVLCAHVIPQHLLAMI